MKKSFLFLCLMGSLLMVPAVAGNSVPATTIQQSVKVQSSSNPKDHFAKTPIKPGEKDTIEVTYNGTGKFPGKFSKTITIRSNAVTEVVRLTVMGEMTE